MIFKPTLEGGRIATGSTPHGYYRVEFPDEHDGPVYDAEGREVGHVMLKIKTPPEAAHPVSAIGDRYRAALHKRLGGVPCGSCNTEQKRLNGMTAERVTAEREQIIEGTVKRALNHPRWRDRIKAKLGNVIAPNQLRRIIGECLDEAIFC